MATLQDLREAYATNGAAAPLINKVIDNLLLIDQRRYAPLRRALPRKTWQTDIFYFNAQTALPKAQFTTQAPAVTDVAATTSTYVQSSFPIKNLQVNLDIPAFTQQVATVNGSLRDLELTAAGKSYAWLEEMAHMFGAQAATINTKRPQWNGFDNQVALSNKIDAGSALLSLSMLDNLIDSVKGVAAQDLGDDWFFLMSGKMQSRANGLFVQQQRFNAGMTKIFARDDFGDPNAAVADNYIDAGVEVATYRNIPIILSSFMGNQGTMGALTVASNNTGSGGGLLSATTYYYVMEAVTRYGLTAASAEVSASPNANGNSIVLTWSTPTPTDAFGNTIDILGYRLFRGTSSGAESLYALISATDLSDAAVVSFTDTGLPVTPDGVTNTTSYWATVAKSGSNAASDGSTFPRIQSGSQNVEDIFLVPRNPEFAVVPVLNEMTMKALAQVNARSNQYALIGDQTFALRSGAFAAKLSRVRSI